MKKALFCIFALFACGGLFAQQQPVVAVAPFDAISGISATDANMITRVFFIRLGNTNKVSLVDRNVVDRVLREHSFQAGDWSNQQKTAELGSALNADWIVRGELEKFGSNILVTVQFYDIQTFRFMGGADVRIPNADAAYDNMDPLVDKLVDTIASTGSGGNRPAARPAADGTYKVGDTGPAGGIVFFDRGFNSSDGWRYLEAAPAGAEFTAQWGACRTIGRNSDYLVVPGISTSLGSGKRNTQLIVDFLNRRGESQSAAQICVSMDINGFTDWFLPSKDELVLMYSNLAMKGLGGFNRSVNYWSSSQSGASVLICYDGGYTTSTNMPMTNSVRAVRAF